MEKIIYIFQSQENPNITIGVMAENLQEATSVVEVTVKDKNDFKYIA
jgi:hypothetical protein